MESLLLHLKAPEQVSELTLSWDYLVIFQVKNKLFPLN